MEVSRMIKKITLFALMLAGTAQTTLFSMRLKRLSTLGNFARKNIRAYSSAITFKQDEREKAIISKKYGNLTINEAAHKIYDTSMKDDELRDLAVGLLQDRINYWYELLEGATTEEARKLVPMYIRRRQNPKITAEEMIDECKFLSSTEMHIKVKKPSGYFSYWAHLWSYIEGNTTAGCAQAIIRCDGTMASSIHIEKNMRRPLMNTMHIILHELTHVEQAQNVPSKMLPTDPRTGRKTILSNHWAQKQIEGNCFDATSNATFREFEADSIPYMINFNPQLFHALPPKFNCSAEMVAAGYLSDEVAAVIAGAFAVKYYQKYPHRMARDQEQVTYWKQHFTK